MPMYEECPICGTRIEHGIGEYYFIRCTGCKRYAENGFHYGLDMFIDGEGFLIDESGYGNKESMRRFEAKLRQVRVERNASLPTGALNKWWLKKRCLSHSIKP